MCMQHSFPSSITTSINVSWRRLPRGLDSASSITLGGSFLVGDSAVGVFGIEMERSSSILVVVEDWATLVEEFFLNWSKCLYTLLPSVRSTVNEDGPVLEYMTPGSQGSPALKFLTKTESPSTNLRSLAWKSCNFFCWYWFWWTLASRLGFKNLSDNVNDS